MTDERSPSDRDQGTLKEPHRFAPGLLRLRRAIKPANVLYDGQRWRLCDFGFAVVCGGRLLKKACGTLAYSAPELLLAGSEGSPGYIGAQVDLWALGCMVYEMRVGRAAFIAPDLESLRLRIRNGFKGGSETQPWLGHMKKERSLISALLASAPEKRISAEKVLGHRWLTAHCGPAVGAAARAQAEGPQPVWWCDVAGEGCLRPTEGRCAGPCCHSSNYLPPTRPAPFHHSSPPSPALTTLWVWPVAATRAATSTVASAATASTWFARSATARGARSTRTG